MARSVNDGFVEFLSRLTPTAAQRSASQAHRESVKDALTARMSVNNFFETGSFTHGTGIRNYSDVDALASLSDKPSSSYTGLERVKDALAARLPNTAVKIRRPAVVVEFAGGDETWEVIPGFLTGRGTAEQMVYDIPSAVTAGGWIDSAPREHLDYVNECNQKPSRGAAKDLARLLKAWKYYRRVPISSFYLEMRAAQHVTSVSSYIHVWDLCLVLEKLAGHSLAAMNDPKAASGRIYACSSDANKEEALSKLKTAAGRARNALTAHQADKIDDCFYYLDQLYDGHFPAR